MKDFKFISSMDSKDRVDAFKKNEFDELFFQTLNNSLDKNEDLLVNHINELKPKSFPSIILLSVPRSGSTFLTQVIARYLEIGYVSNLMARFYNYPLSGAYLHKKLIKNSIINQNEFNSTHGVTSTISEPHEFGYFWSKYFNIHKDVHQPSTENELGLIDINALENQLNLISNIMEGPVLYKCSIGAFFSSLFSNMSNTIIIHLKRDRNDTIESILRTRQERLGSVHKWWSFRPSNYHDLILKDPLEQVRGQYDMIENSITEGLKSINPDRLINVEYDHLKMDPLDVCKSLKSVLSQHFDCNISLR